MKKIYQSILYLVILLLFTIIFLSLIGIETNKFNNQILNRINKLNNNIDFDLKNVKLILDPFNFKIKAKTLGPKIKSLNSELGLESIETEISLSSLFKNEFSLSNLKVSTKSIQIQKTLSFVRDINREPKLFILEKLVKKGYLIADFNLEFDQNGRIKDNFEIKGFVKDGNINIFEKYNFDKLNFIFVIDNNSAKLEEIDLKFNNLALFFKRLDISKIKNNFLVKGEIDNKNFKIDKKDIIKIFDSNDFGIQKILFNSKNIFSFRLSEKYKLSDLFIESKLKIKELIILNKVRLKEILPDVKDKIIFQNNSLNIKYESKKGFYLKGQGDIFIQKEIDKIYYFFEKKNQDILFDTKIETLRNPIQINFINFKKNQEIKTTIDIKGSRKKNKTIQIDEISLKDKENIIQINGILLDENNKIIRFNDAKFDFFDNEIKKFIFN